MATEESVGCRCFVTPASSLPGIIKHRYSDFHVHEISSDGSVVRLTTLEPLDLPEYPDGYLEWLGSGQIFFKFRKTSDAQIARIYQEQSCVEITDKDGTVTLERTQKRKVHALMAHFVLYKENMNQQEAIGRIAERLSRPKKAVGFAGTKDKRGITTQRCSIRDMGDEEGARLGERVPDGMRLGMFVPAINPISLGELSGNRFAIAVKDIKGENEEIQTRLVALQEKGFLNYFGMQRFGTGPIPTHDLGKMVLRQEWSQLVETLLAPHEGEPERWFAAKKHYQKTKNARDALNMLPRAAQAERALLSAVMNDPKGRTPPRALFNQVERRQRMLYVHAYQSYLWNNLVSERWTRHGHQVVPGDDVCIDGEIIHVTEDNMSLYSPFDIVIALPSASAGASAADLMSRDGVSPDMFAALAKEYGTPGDWRPMLAQAKDLEWRIATHDSMDDTLIDSDMDKIMNRSDIHENPEGAIKSLVVEFSLGSSQYATMCLREVLKRTTEWFTDSAMSQGPGGGQSIFSRCSVA